MLLLEGSGDVAPISTYELWAIWRAIIAIVIALPAAIYAVFSAFRDKRAVDIWVEYLYTHVKDDVSRFKFTFINKSNKPFSIVKIQHIGTEVTAVTIDTQPIKFLLNPVPYHSELIDGNANMSVVLGVNHVGDLGGSAIFVIYTNTKKYIKKIKFTTRNT